MNYNNYGNFFTPYSQPQQVRTPEPNLLLKGRPVSSIEEAKASMIDFDGSVFFFPDLANGRIYTKQINVDGSSLLKMYEIKEVPTNVPVGFNPKDYITREEFIEAIKSLKGEEAPTAPKAELPPGTFSF